MKIDKKKLNLAMARKCLTTAELSTVAEMPRSTVNRVVAGKSAKPWTVGKIANALGVDVTEIIETEN